MPRKIIFLVSVILTMALAGCITVQMPPYVKDKNPYDREFYASYDKTILAVTDALEKLGWTIAKHENPAVFESDSVEGAKAPKQVLLFTNVRQSAMIFGTNYVTMNIFVKEKNEKTTVEIRYYGVFSTVLRNIETYRNDSFVEKVFSYIEKALDVSGADEKNVPSTAHVPAPAAK